MSQKGTVESAAKPKGRGSVFVDIILPRLATDPAFAAALTRADNPATEHQSWEYLVRYGCNIENNHERHAYVTVAAALARAKPARDGSLDIASALARCFENGNASDSARAKIRRLLACADAEEACQISRPMLSLIVSRAVPVSFGRTLDDLLYFGERVKLAWAKAFYRGTGDEG